MKLVLALLFVLLSYLSVASAACIPEIDCTWKSGSGQPDCSKYTDGSTFRNLYDPVHYWQCVDGAAVSVLCRAGYFYQAANEKCVPVADWIWEPECDPEYPIQGGSSSASGGSKISGSTSCSN